MAEKKWIKLKSSRESVRRVAARMLRSRLAAIRHYLPLAAKKAAENVEYIHQLRVWSRRAEVAVAFCKNLLSNQQVRQLAKYLKQVRRAAADARDADVLIQRVTELKSGAAREHLLPIARKEREAAQQPVLEVASKLRGGRRLMQLLEAIEKRFRRKRKEKVLQQCFVGWGQKRFRRIARAFLKLGKQDLSDLECLHQFRIASKELRYSLELAGHTLASSPRKLLYREIVQLQTRLGSINDSARFVDVVQNALLQTKKRTVVTQLRRVLTAEKKRLAAAQAAWSEHWTNQRRKKLKRRLKKCLA